MSLARKLRLFILCVLALTLSTGCASSAKISQYERFATAGAQYAQAMDELLTTSATVMIDNSSMNLLIPAEELRREAARVEALAGDFPEKQKQARILEQGRKALNLEVQLRDADNAVEEHLQAIATLRPQVALLSVYFTQLAALATTDAPAQFEQQLANTVDSINGLSNELRGSSAFGPKLAEVIPIAGSLIVKSAQSKYLKKELESSKETIVEVLRLHQELLQLIAEQLRQDRRVRFSESHRFFVKEPLVNLTYDQESWMKTRRALMTPPVIDAQLDSTRMALARLETAWRKLLTNELTLADVEGVISDLQPVLAALAG